MNLMKSDSKQLANLVFDNVKWILILVIVIFTIIYIVSIIQQRDNNLSNLKNFNNEFISYQNLINQEYFNVQLSNPDRTYDLKLKDFYIKTSYNSCCSGKFKNDYVDIQALENCAKNGVRALDFQIYSLDGEPIVAASSIETNYFKETYNHIPLRDALRVVKREFLSGGDKLHHKLKDDPLFIFFRIHYGPHNQSTEEYSSSLKNFYNIIYETFQDIFENDLMEHFYSKRYPKTSVTFGDVSGSPIDFFQNSTSMDRIATTSMNDLKQHIFLFVTLNDVDANNLYESKLSSITDGVLGPNSFMTYRRNELGNENSYSLSNIHKQQLGICLPALGSQNSNYDFSLPVSIGIQFVAMNFQNADNMLDYYDTMFKSSQYKTSNVCIPYIKKPNHMIEFPNKLSALFNNINNSSNSS